MTVKRLKELMTGVDDSADVIIYGSEWGMVPASEVKVSTKCYECTDGRIYFPHHDIECLHCKGTGKHLQMILGD